MVTMIDPIENPTQSPPHAKVNPADRSSSDHEKRRFKQDLKKKMDRDTDEEGEDRSGDSVIIEINRKESGPDRSDEVTDDVPNDMKNNEPKEDETPSPEHIDFKA